MDFNEDEDFDFNFDDLSPEEKAEIEQEQKERDRHIKNHPLYKKAWDIMKTVDALTESFPDEDTKEMYSSTLTESAMMLAPKIAGAIGSESWLFSMQNASIIRYHAEYLLTSTSGIKMFVENADKDYIQVLRDDMFEFQCLFNEWVKEINRMEREEYVDEWGLFLRD